MAGRLQGKVAIITGANSGIGKKTAELFAQEGASVVVAGFDKAKATKSLDSYGTAVNRIEPCADVADQINAAGGVALAVPTDVCSEGQVGELFAATIERFGKIDILVNNAGRMDDMEAVDKVTDKMLYDVFDTNFYGAVHCTREAFKYMADAGAGVIVNTSSRAAVHGVSGIAYAASKAALICLTQHTATYGMEKGIRCNAVAPLGVATALNLEEDMVRWDTEMLGALMKHLAPVPVIEPAQVADALLFLASDMSGAINGQILELDFGAAL